MQWDYTLQQKHKSAERSGGTEDIQIKKKEIQVTEYRANPGKTRI